MVAKRVGRVNLHFDPGQARAQVDGAATTLVSRAAATLPEDIRRQITRKRKAGESLEEPRDTRYDEPSERAEVERKAFDA